MSTTSLTNQIAQALANGLEHPGNPKAGEAPHILLLPMFRTAGMPPQMKQAIQASTLAIAQAVIHLIEQEHTITPKGTAHEHI